MEVQAITKNVRISAFKCRDIARNIQGKPAAAALENLKFVPQKAARLISKTLKSALANAENNNNLNTDSLRIKEAIIGEGITIKRFATRARGSAGPIRKRTSHIKITLTDEPAPEKVKPTSAKTNPSRKTKKAPSKE